MELFGLESISGVFKTWLLGRRLNDLVEVRFHPPFLPSADWVTQINLVSGGRYTPLTMLPLEIIVEILKELDWYSLLKIRLVRLHYLALMVQDSCYCQTCRLLNSLSRLRDIWISQYHQYVAQRMRSARLEEPLDSYSAQELEQLVLVRRSADIGWKCQNVKFSGNRWIRRKDATATCLFPGSRWLLAGDQYGAMSVYDLDASTITERPLIPRDDQNEPQAIHHIVIEVDPPKQSPNLTFTMVLSTAVHYSKPCSTCG
jgi:hypothetical protein